ncbi:mannose-1-phosphate guanylyltransferase [candidate division KSB1 bacterium]|nr:mannose-1-phosphate guanylyltransferase [candidate division KSB1 bacterium]
MENTIALIMAGGGGTRFWPKSRQSIPKQFLSLLGNETMLQLTANRLTNLVDRSNLYIVSTKEQKRLINEQLPWLLPGNLISEPFANNTAPCIGLSALHIQQKNPDTIMVVSPADHLITDNEKFIKVIQNGIRMVRQNPGYLVTIGIEPTYPSTGYGYIQKGEPLETFNGKSYRVRTFAEKPDRDIAQKFYHSKEFYWNSGIFIWHVDTILQHFQQLLPEIYFGLNQIKKALGSKTENKITENVYNKLYNQSIDYGILEKAEHVIVMEGGFGWSDIGSWEEVYKISSKDECGNVSKGDILLKDVNNCYIETTGKTACLVGVDDLIIVDTDDALLICKKELSQEVKWIVEELKKRGKEKHL